MSCLLRIQSHYPSLTKTDQLIAAYIKENIKEVVHFSAQELASEAKTSPAAIIRFSKALGYKGYPALKLDLVQDIDHQEDQYHSLLLKEESLESVNKKIIASMKHSLDTTEQINSADLFRNIAKRLHLANRIYLVGLGASSLVANDLYYKLIRINKEAHFHQDLHILMTSIAHADEGSVLVVVSYSGMKQSINHLVLIAKQRGVFVVCITSDKKSMIAKNSDAIISLPTGETDVRLAAINSTMASLAAINMLYIAMVKLDMDGVYEKIVYTRSLIQQLEKN